MTGDRHMPGEIHSASDIERIEVVHRGRAPQALVPRCVN